MRKKNSNFFYAEDRIPTNANVSWKWHMGTHCTSTYGESTGCQSKLGRQCTDRILKFFLIAPKVHWDIAKNIYHTGWGMSSSWNALTWTYDSGEGFLVEFTLRLRSEG